jgi:hypothetical protein
MRKNIEARGLTTQAFSVKLYVFPGREYRYWGGGIDARFWRWI